MAKALGWGMAVMFWIIPIRELCQDIKHIKRNTAMNQLFMLRLHRTMRASVVLCIYREVSMYSNGVHLLSKYTYL